MEIFKNILRKSSYLRGVFIGPSSEYIPDFQTISSAGVNVNHKNALTFTGAFSAISTKAENMASLPKQVFKSTSKGNIIEKKHPVYNLIHFQPNPMMNDFTFWEKISNIKESYWLIAK